jgi:hypothetical protein
LLTHSTDAVEMQVQAKGNQIKQCTVNAKVKPVKAIYDFAECSFLEKEKH